MLKRKQQKNTFLQFNNLNLQSYLRGFVGEEGRIFLMYSIDMKDTCTVNLKGSGMITAMFGLIWLFGFREYF
jgi:hypothetical protein